MISSWTLALRIWGDWRISRGADPRFIEAEIEKSLINVARTR